MNSPRALYDATMAEYFAVRGWWQTITPERRRAVMPRVDSLDWGFLSGIERWIIVRDAISAGLVASERREAA